MKNQTQLIDQARRDLDIVTDHANQGLPWNDTLAGHIKACWSIVRSRKALVTERSALFTALHRFYQDDHPMKFLADATGISIGTLSNQFHALGLDTHLPTRRTSHAGPPARTYAVDVEAFADPANEETAYWLGFLWADGSLIRPSRDFEGVKLRLKQADRDHVERFRAFLGSSHMIRDDLSAKLINGRQHPGAEIRIYSVDLARRLVSLGFSQRLGGTANIGPPPEIRLNERAFWRGMVDGDGSIRRDQRAKLALAGWKLELAGTRATTELFGEFITQHFQGNIDIRPNGDGGTNFRISTQGPLAVEMITYLYPPGCIALNRKQQLAEKISHGFTVATAAGIRPCWVGSKRKWVGSEHAKDLVNQAMRD